MGAFLHAEQPHAAAAQGLPLRAPEIAAVAVVAHAQAEHAVFDGERDPYVRRLGVPDDVGERALRHAEAGDVDLGWQQVGTRALALRPPQLVDLGLGTTLRSYAERLAKPARLKLHFSAGELPGLPPQIDIACFRVAQGALTNVLRHAQASNVWVTLAVEHGMLCLCVRDDGNGCDLRRAQRHALRGRSMGLLSMEERTALAGGRFSIRSEPAAGMEVHADFPIAVEAPATADES